MTNLGASGVECNNICRLDERPLQIPIHVRPGLAIVDFTPRGVHPWCCSRVGGKAWSVRKPTDLSDLKKNDHRQYESHSRQRLQKFHQPTCAEGLPHPCLEVRDLILQLFQYRQ